MNSRIGAVLYAVVLGFACARSAAHGEDTDTAAMPPMKASAAVRSQQQPSSAQASTLTPTRPRVRLPCQAFTNPPEKGHDPAANVFAFDQLEHYYRVPGEFSYRLTGDQYGFETLSFIITETHPGGGPGLHLHDTEEAHILLEGTAQYRIGDKTFTVNAPYIAKVPAGLPHTFINVGAEPFNLVAVFASKHPSTERIGPNPLIPAWQLEHGSIPCKGP
jgi:mannose-6-phosphate isomerase-like protein (cupin superfamily)